MRTTLIASMLMAGLLVNAGTMSVYASPTPQQQVQGAVTIKGMVLDENNEAVIGASVVQTNNRKNAVSTDFDGNFTIRVAPGTPLTVSYVGYKTEEVKASQSMMVYLQPTTEMLDELVAIGYGTQKKANLTGAVSTVDVAKVMDSRPVQDVTKALQGAVPGLTITSDQGGVNSVANIRIRGIGSLTNGEYSNPLIVVDGVPVDNLAFLNPEDIAEISVIKDASSSAIYGTRAAYGVILITTKSPAKQDKVSLTYTNNIGWSQATMMPQMAHNVDQMDAAIAVYNRTGNSQFLSSEVGGMNLLEMRPLAQAWWDQHGGKPYTKYCEVHPYVDENNVGDFFVKEDGTWLRYAEWDVPKTLFTSAAPQQKHNISLEGTSGKTQYRMSFGYDKKQDLQRYNPETMSRYMANVSVSTELFSWLKAGSRVSYAERKATSPSLARNSFQYLWRWPSYMEFYGWLPNPNTDEPMSFYNDIAVRSDAYMQHFTDRQMRLQGWAQATLFKDLVINADFTYDARTAHGHSGWNYQTAWNTWTPNAYAIWYSPAYGTAGQQMTYAGKSTDEDARWTFNLFATYAKTFKKDHNLKVMVGGMAEQETYNYLFARRNGVLDFSLLNLALTDGGKGGTQLNISSADSHRATAGFFGRINYDYKGIYLLELNGRYDGSSSFPANKQWAFFPSVSAGYRFSEEQYFKPLADVISNGKLRASWGHIGNQAIGNNMFISTFAVPSKMNWLNTDGNRINQQYFPSVVSGDLTWERIITTDVGLDLGFFSNSLMFGFDWFTRETKDMLAPGAQLPSVMGTGAPYQNAGAIRTNGWELSLSYNRSFGEANVFASFNISDARTKVTKWDNPSGIIYTYRPGSVAGYYEGGYYGDVWGLEFDRYFTEDDFEGKDANGRWIPKPGIADQSMLENGSFNFGPGDVKFVDQNGDGFINGGDPKSEYGTGTVNNHGDYKVIGNAMPRYEYSFRLGGSWKNFDVDFFFQGVGQRKMWVMNSQVIPFPQFTGALYSHQLDRNQILYDDALNVIGYDIDQNNAYPNIYSGDMAYQPYYSLMSWQGVNNYTANNRYITNMAYLRLKNVTLGYTLPVDITTKALIQKARIYFSCENPCFLYNAAGKYKMDPEIATADSGSFGSNGYGAFGRTNNMKRVYSFGIQVTF